MLGLDTIEDKRAPPHGEKIGTLRLNLGAWREPHVGPGWWAGSSDGVLVGKLVDWDISKSDVKMT